MQERLNRIVQGVGLTREQAQQREDDAYNYMSRYDMDMSPCERRMRGLPPIEEVPDDPNVLIVLRRNQPCEVNGCPDTIEGCVQYPLEG